MIYTFTIEKLYNTQEEQLLIIWTLGSRASTKNNGAKKPNYRNVWQKRSLMPWLPWQQPRTNKTGSTLLD